VRGDCEGYTPTPPGKGALNAIYNSTAKREPCFALQGKCLKPGVALYLEQTVSLVEDGDRLAGLLIRLSIHLTR
jgi:hypothetical protein